METNKIVSAQNRAFEKSFSSPRYEGFVVHTTKNPLTRFLRDHRLNLAIDHLTKLLMLNLDQIRNWRVLIVCGGAGGEAIFFANLGFRNITNSDFSKNALSACKSLNYDVKTLLLNAECLELADSSFDLVVVQDGLHHLSRPVLGFTEILRVAKKAIIVIEPHSGLIPQLIGKKWEENGNACNYVFRWNKNLLLQASKSFLLKNVKQIKDIRVWDHSMAILKMTKWFPDRIRLPLVKYIYLLLNTFLSKFGNNMIGIVIKN